MWNCRLCRRTAGFVVGNAADDGFLGIVVIG
jgi:hypothetical protein